MITNGIDLEKRRIVVFENAGNIGVELFAFLVANQGPSPLCAEHQMDNNVGEGLRHNCCALTGLLKFVGTLHPALQAGLSHCGLSARNSFCLVGTIREAMVTAR